MYKSEWQVEKLTKGKQQSFSGKIARQCLQPYIQHQRIPKGLDYINTTNCSILFMFASMWETPYWFVEDDCLVGIRYHLLDVCIPNPYAISGYMNGRPSNSCSQGWNSKCCDKAPESLCSGCLLLLAVHSVPVNGCLVLHKATIQGGMARCPA